jgi:hypothetical protein
MAARNKPEETATPDVVAEKKEIDGATTLDSDVTKPSVTAPGDGPADTTDPTEIASTVIPQPGPEAFAVGTVNAVVKTGEIPEVAQVDEKDHRVEEYDATKPDGSVVRVRHNIDTGETSIVSK